jgi:hypothetical protein
MNIKAIEEFNFAENAFGKYVYFIWIHFHSVVIVDKKWVLSGLSFCARVANFS